MGVERNPILFIGIDIKGKDTEEVLEDLAEADIWEYADVDSAAYAEYAIERGLECPTWIGSYRDRMMSRDFGLYTHDIRGVEDEEIDTVLESIEETTGCDARYEGERVEEV